MPNRPIHSCVRCSDRKVKCDRQRPCSACVKHNVDCIFNPVEQPRKRQKRVKEQILTDRIKQYEAILRERGINPIEPPKTPDPEPSRDPIHVTAATTDEPHMQTPSSFVSDITQSDNMTQIVHGQGRSKIVENTLWTRVVEEFHTPEDALEELSNGESDPEESDEEFGFVLSNQLNTKTTSRHPPSERIFQLWQIYVENVDPLTKVVHVPTLRPAIQKAASNLEAIPRNFEALMFAIYSASVMTLREDDCVNKLGESRKTLLTRYVSATEKALARAKFMGTISLVVLQALILHIISVRDIYEPRALWSLTGVAVRIAQSMGLERDGTALGLPPFESEIRRRIWWQLKSHDFRSAELCGLAKFRDLETGAENTRWPSNINDDQLYPGMTSIALESNPMTDNVCLAVRYELMNFAAARVHNLRGQGKVPGQWDLHTSGNEKIKVDGAVRELQDLLETKYLRYCDPSQPLHLLAMLIARYAMNVVRFLTNHPRKWASSEETPSSERQLIWEVSLKLLEQHNMLHSSSQLRSFWWHAPYFIQWHAYIHVIDTLRAKPLMADAEKAWHLIGGTYNSTPETFFDTKKPIHVAVGNLCLKAYSAREAALQNANQHIPPIPGFISRLRQQREAAKVKRQARDLKNKKLLNTVTHIQPNEHGMSSKTNVGLADLSNTLGSTHLQQSMLSYESNLPQSGNTIENDPFWFIDGLDSGLVGIPNDMMNLDPDFILADDYVMGDNGTQTVSWDQWDAWLADSNVMRPAASA